MSSFPNEKGETMARNQLGEADAMGCRASLFESLRSSVIACIERVASHGRTLSVFLRSSVIARIERAASHGRTLSVLLRSSLIARIKRVAIHGRTLQVAFSGRARP